MSDPWQGKAISLCNDHERNTQVFYETHRSYQHTTT